MRALSSPMFCSSFKTSPSSSSLEDDSIARSKMVDSLRMDSESAWHRSRSVEDIFVFCLSRDLNLRALEV